MTTTTPTKLGEHQFPCRQCGANLKFEPGTQSLQCPYCGTANDVPHQDGHVSQEDFARYLAALSAGEPHHEQLTVKCASCGAQTAMPADVTAEQCPFCGSGIVATQMSHKSVKPKALLPFHVTRDQAAGQFQQWVSHRWFAPSGLSKAAQRCAIHGTYLPYWTYDDDAASSYTGQRGDDYWATETYTAIENNRTVTRTRQVRKTRWTPVSGQVFNHFDDLLVMASASLPERYLEALQPWDLQQLTPYTDEYISGFVCESYQVNLAEGFEKAKELMQPTIRRSIELDIGGDHQTIDTVSTRYGNVTFKHILLPVWISAYLYNNKTYRFLVNARTGRVRGERPYSILKISITVLLAASAIITAVMLLNK